MLDVFSKLVSQASGTSLVQNLPANVGDTGSIPELGGSPMLQRN